MSPLWRHPALSAMIGEMDLGDTPDLEAMATVLEASGRYRVLRKLDPHSPAAGSKVPSAPFLTGDAAERAGHILGKFSR
jgi:hypothetical protein